MYLYLFPCPLLLFPTLFLLPFLPPHSSLCTGAGSGIHSHSESGDSPPPSVCPPRHHTLSTLTGSESRCSSSSAAESALLSAGEKTVQAGAELKMVSVYAYQSMLLLTCGFCLQTPSVDSGVASHLTSMLPSESEGTSLMYS